MSEVHQTPCKTCDAPMVFMLTSKNQKEIPIDVDSIDEDALEWGTSPRHGTPIPLFQHGVHIPHFTTCPDADQHRRRT